MVSRREFLQLTGGALASCAAAPLWLRLGSAGAEPVPASGHKLLVLLLAGGNDGLNSVIPYSSSLYYARRPTIAYQPDKVLKLPDSSDVGLNPSLPALARLYGEGKVAVVQGVGYDKADLSHFGSMDIWQTGSPTHALATGWLGRYLDLSAEGTSIVRAAAVGNELPLALVGEEESGVAVPSLSGFAFVDGNDADPASESYRLHEAFRSGADGGFEGVPARALLASQRKTVAAVRAINQLADPKSPPPAELADRVSIAMTLLASDLGVEVGFVTLGSFDDHAATGVNHPRLLAEVDAAVARFTEEAAQRGNPGDYLLMTFSEFGRRVEEDGSAGTDHGTAAPLFVVGDAVAGGLHGEHPKLDALDENGNLVRTVEFREVYATVLDRWLAGSAATDVLRYSSADGLHPVNFLR